MLENLLCKNLREKNSEYDVLLSNCFFVVCQSINWLVQEAVQKTGMAIGKRC